MAKKFFDIIPPEKVEEQVIQKKPVLAKPKKKRKWVLKSSVILVVCLILLLIFGFFFFPKTEIEIKPEKFTITLQDDLTVDFSTENSLEDERFIEKDFPATGQTTAEKKATGTITVYNEYSTSPRTLIPSRFVSADGKLFWSTKTITIPGYKKEGTRIIPGQVEVAVEAAKPGKEYNIGPSTFALPALAGSALYTTIYAKSFSDMTGGSIGQASSVTEEDLENAKGSLIEETKHLSKEAMFARAPLGFILLDETISQEILEATSSAKEGDAVDSFKYKVSVKSTAFYFKKEILDNFINNLINSNLKEDEEFLEDNLEISYSSDAVNIEVGDFNLKVTVKANVYKKINVDDLKKALLGRTEGEARLILQSLDNISDFTLKNKPFLKRTLPKEPEKIEIVVSLD